MKVNRNSFILVSEPDPHIERRAKILENYPEIRQLIGPNPYSMLLIILLVTLQLTLAWVMSSQHWLVSLLTAFFIGAYITGSLNALIHDAAHNLIFRTLWKNRIAAIIANFPLITVSAESFRRYHYDHHFSMGDYNMDVGIPTEWEAKWVGNRSFRKFLWLTFFIFFQLGRTKKYVSEKSFIDRWMIANFIIIIAVNGVLLYFWGLSAVVYLFLCFFFSFGLHPLGARVIQEHFMVEEGQETYNYSGKANVFECNFGCHNEHHDFPSVPWNRLPKISKIAKEFYVPLKHHPSRWKLIYTFISDADWNLYRHSVRVQHSGE